ncbi:MAG: general secretion pathway protein GspD [Microbacteriaceae bacterium]|nr:general secretion pathway protein GspD [Burkholderiaceae bacterium]
MRALLGGAVVVLLAGCAAQSAYRDAQVLLANQQPDAGLAKLEEAVARDAGNTEYRVALLLTRQKLLATTLEQADRALAADRRAEADQRYRRALQIEPSSQQARQGLAVLARDDRHAKTLDQAEAQWLDKSVEAARSQAAAVLEENPRNERARALLRTIEAASDAKPSPTQTRLAAAYRLPVSIDFKEATVKQVFEIIARSSGLNILFDKDVKTDQKTSISLKNSSVEAAIQYMLMANQLEQQVMDANTLLVFPNNAAKLRDYQQLVVKTFVLANANAKPMAEMIRTMVKSRDLVIDEKLNMVIMRDSADAVRLAEKLVTLLDVAEPEVMLEVEILEVSRDRLMELGVNWPSSLSLMPLAGASGQLTLADLRRVNSDSVAASLAPLKINARNQDGDTNLLANPRIRVLNREKARVMIGNKVPSISTTVIATGLATESVVYLDVGLKLEVEPIIYVNNDVTIKMALEVSNILSFATTAQGTTTYNIGSRSVTTTLRLKDGENQVLAGLINDEDRRTANKVPGLGELPLAGRLFGSTLNDGKKSEIVLSITPRLIRNVQRPTAAAGEFLSGTDGSLRRRAVPGSAAPAPDAEAGAVVVPTLTTTPTPATAAPPAPLANPVQ